MSNNKVLGRTAAAFVAVLMGLAAIPARADIRISGSDTLEPYFQDASSQFARSDGAGVPITASYKGSIAGLKDLCLGLATISPSSTKIDAAISQQCADRHIGVVELPLAFDAIVVIANPHLASAGELSLAELKAIFTPENAGKVVRWSQVRPSLADAPLTVISLDPKSGTNAFFSSQVVGMKGFVRPDAKVTADHAEVIRRVAAEPGAIGFVSMGALAESKAAVWKVPVNFGHGPVVASRDTVLNGSYATLSRLLYVYASKAGLSDKDGQSQKFLRWLMERGSKLATYENFVPLIEQDYQDNTRRILAK